MNFERPTAASAPVPTLLPLASNPGTFRRLLTMAAWHSSASAIVVMSYMLKQVNNRLGYPVVQKLACPSSGLRTAFRCGLSLRIVDLPKDIHQELLECKTK